MKVIRSLGLLYAAPPAILVVGVVGGLVLGRGPYLAAFAVGAAATVFAVFAVIVARMRAREQGITARTNWTRIAVAAVGTIVLVVLGLLPVRSQLFGGPDLLTADGLRTGLDELRRVSTTYDEIYLKPDVLRGQIGERAVIYRDGDLDPGPEHLPGPDAEDVFDLSEVDFSAVPGLIDLARRHFPGGGEVFVYVARPIGGGPVGISVHVDLPAPEGSAELLADADGNPLR